MDKLLHWCAGVDLRLIQRAAPQDRGRYVMLGVFILFTALLSATSMFFMAGYITPNVPACLAMALAWGAFIFSIDRYLAISITSFKAHVHPGDQQTEQSSKTAHPHTPSNLASPGYLVAVSTRLVAAIFLSIIISIPVKLALFEPDINGQLAIENRDAATDFFVFNPQITAFKKERENIQKKIEQLRNATQAAEKNMALRYQQMKDESNGRGGSGKKGFGPYYEQAKGAYEQAKNSWANTQKTNATLIESLISEDKKLQNNISSQTETVAIEATKDDGLLNRYRALGKLAATNSQINITLWLITLLFIFIESFPVLTKASQKRDSYEKLLVKLALEEHPRTLTQFLANQDAQLQQEIADTPFVVPNHYRVYLIMLGIALCTVFPFIYDLLAGIDHALTPTLVLYMFSPLVVILSFIVAEMSVLRARILWQSLKPSEDLNFSLQAVTILLMPVAVLLFLALTPKPDVITNSFLVIDTSPLADHAAFWTGWGIFYFVLITLITRHNTGIEPGHESARQAQISRVEHKLQRARQAYRKGSLSLYGLTALCAGCCFLLYVKLPSHVAHANFWPLLSIFTGIPVLAAVFYGMGARVPLTTLLSIANTRLKQLYTLSVVFFTITATGMCAALALNRFAEPLLTHLANSTSIQAIAAPAEVGSSAHPRNSLLALSPASAGASPIQYSVADHANAQRPAPPALTASQNHPRLPAPHNVHEPLP